MNKNICSGCPLCINGIYGTGSLLIDKQKQQILLVTDNTTPYTDIGGFIDQSIDISTHTNKILYEKSFKLISQNVNNCIYFDVPYGMFHKYRIYVIFINNNDISCRKFNNSNSNNMINGLKHMIAISIKQFKDEYVTSGKITNLKVATDRSKIKIDDRIVSIMYELIRCNLI